MPLPSDTRRLTEPQAILLLREWQRELGLKDWHVKAAVSSNVAPLHGHVRIVEEKKCAYIRLLDPSLADESEVEPLDMEIALVHELLHVELVSLARPEGTHGNTIQEQAIHKLSKRLVAMKRTMRKMARKAAA